MLKLAWKGFRRYRKRRKNLTVVIVCSCVLLLFFWSLFSQINANMRKFWMDRFVGGNIIINSDVKYYDFYTPISMDHVFSFSGLQKRLLGNKAILAPRLRTVALFEKKQEQPLITIGIVPEVEQELGNHIRVTKGKWCRSGKKEVMLTSGTARTIGVTIGDKVVFTVKTHNGYPSYERLTVVGFVSFGTVGFAFGSNIAYMPLDELQELTLLDSDSVNEVVTNSDLVKHKLGENYRFVPGTSAFSMSRLISIGVRAAGLLLLIVLGTFLFQTVAHNIVIMLDERMREIGVFLTFGARPSWIRCIMALELFLYALYCMVLGSVLGTLLIWGFNSLGFYSVDIATEILMSSSHFVISLYARYYVICFAVISLLLGLAASISIVRNTARKSIRSISMD